MKPIKIEHDDIKKAIQKGNSYIQVGNKKYLLMEVQEVYNSNDGYVVTDPEEEKQLLKALNEYNPIVSHEEIKNILEK